EDTPLVFSSANGNQIAIADVDAGSSVVQVALVSTHGWLTLSGTSGLTFSAGDGTSDAIMTFTGTIGNINAALNGMSFAPYPNYNGSAGVQIVTNDQGNSGSGGSLSDTDSWWMTVSGVNDAPVGTTNTVTTFEDTAKLFSA